MVIAVLPHLYAQPQDVYDFLSVEATQLLMDDQSLATGQTVTASASALQGATTLFVNALQYPMLAGNVLIFSGAGMADFATVQLSTVAAQGATVLSVNPLPENIPAGAQAQDNGVNVAFGQRLVKGCNYGTTQVQLYCLNRYDDSVLYQNALQNGSVNRWATALSARWVCRRRANGCPKAILEECEEAMEELRGVRLGQLCIEGTGTRTSGWPFLSNVTVNPAYEYAKIRVEQPLSEATPTQYSQYVDWNSAYLLEGW